MKVSGFTFVRNAVKFDYPIVESILSALPLVDELVVMLGQSEDETANLIAAIKDPRIRIFPSVWDDNLRQGGRVLALETNKALSRVAEDADWALYLQADEVLHEADYDTIKKAMQYHKDDKRVEGLLFHYRHFYGSFDYVGDSRRWYPKEIRIIRPHRGITSYRDAQGFRKNGKKLSVKLINATIHHYGWVKHPALQQAKQAYFNKLWHSDQWMQQNVPNRELFDYSQIDALAKFTGRHPGIMQERIAKQNWHFTFDPTQTRWTLKSRFHQWFYKCFGFYAGQYKNYRII